MAHFVKVIRKEKTSPQMRPYHGVPCPYCGIKMVAPKHGVITDLYPSKDHVIPASQGGYAILIACRGCNTKKGDMDPYEFLETIPGKQRAIAREAIAETLRGTIFAASLMEAKNFSTTAMEEAFRRSGVTSGEKPLETSDEA